MLTNSGPTTFIPVIGLGLDQQNKRVGEQTAQTVHQKLAVVDARIRVFDVCLGGENIVAHIVPFDGTDVSVGTGGRQAKLTTMAVMATTANASDMPRT
jgi:hypothetical protein